MKTNSGVCKSDIEFISYFSYIRCLDCSNNFTSETSTEGCKPRLHRFSLLHYTYIINHLKAEKAIS